MSDDASLKALIEAVSALPVTRTSRSRRSEPSAAPFTGNPRSRCAGPRATSPLAAPAPTHTTARDAETEAA